MPAYAAGMSVFRDPKQASKALIAFGGVLMGLCAKFANDAETPLPLIGAYIGFVMLIRGMWLAWKTRKM